MPVHRAILAAQGISLVPLPVDDEGARVHELAGIEEEAGRIGAVLLTPAHQSPTGVALSSPRRAALLAWAAQTEAWRSRTTYDAEYRYDRPPLARCRAWRPTGSCTWAP